MASISYDKSGNCKIQFAGMEKGTKGRGKQELSDGTKIDVERKRKGNKRYSINLGELPRSDAEEIKKKIERLILFVKRKRPIDTDTADWLTRQPNLIYDKLANAGYAAKRELPAAEVKPAREAEAVRLRSFLDGYVDRRSDVKDSTATVYGHTRRCLIEYFGADKPMTEITPAEADDWRRWLGKPIDTKNPAAGGQGLSDNTVRRRRGIARQFFNDAVRRRLIAESPFADMKGVIVRSNRKRDYFVSREEADAVLSTCPDNQWRLLFALSRYGGLRCPSEHLALRWGDVDWKFSRITIHSPKTEHHEGRATRTMPIFPELRPLLQAVLNELLADFDPKEQRLSEQFVITRYRDANANLRTQLCKIIRRAGLEPWPKLFQNLRATRATELADDYPSHVAADWLGHSATIADKHYRQTTETHFARAIGEVVQNPVQSTGKKEVQEGAPRRSGENVENALNQRSSEFRDSDSYCVPLRLDAPERMGDTGLEPVTSAV